MGRLTPEMIESASQYLNPVGQYELSLRGKIIEMIFDIIDINDEYFRFKNSGY
jgi:hypothetical protein